MANSQHKYLLERGWSQQQIDEVIRKAHEWLRGAGYTPLTEQGHWNGIMGSTQSYHLPSREKDARGMTEAFVEMLKGGKILDASRLHKFSRPGQPEQFAKQVISTRGNKRAEISGPDGSGQWRAYVIQKSPTGLPSEPYHEDLLGDMKFFDTEEKARRAASKMLASRPGAKDTMAVEDRFYFGKGRKERFANSPFEQIAGQERLSDAITKMGSANAMLDVLAYFARQYGKERIVKAVRNTYSSARAQEILSKLFATI